ncbi:hypothetical protein SLE2022_133770 [Rubroshorea leprosula]
MQVVTVSGNHENIPTSQANALRGKGIVNSISIDKLYINDSSTSATGKPSTNFQMLASGSSLAGSSQASRVQGRGLAIPRQMAYQAISS